MTADGATCTGFGTAASYRSIHSAAAQLQPTKVPLTDEEQRLLSKLGEPDQETRGYLNELYDDFDVGAEKKKEQRQRTKDSSKDEVGRPNEAHFHAEEDKTLRCVLS